MQIEEWAASMDHAANFGDSHPIVLWDAKARRCSFLYAAAGTGARRVGTLVWCWRKGVGCQAACEPMKLRPRAPCMASSIIASA